MRGGNPRPPEQIRDPLPLRIRQRTGVAIFRSRSAMGFAVAVTTDLAVRLDPHSFFASQSLHPSRSQHVANGRLMSLDPRPSCQFRPDLCQALMRTFGHDFSQNPLFCLSQFPGPASLSGHSLPLGVYSRVDYSNNIFCLHPLRMAII